MNIELKPIAESKVRQMGGDVCGVLVRKDDKLAAVDEHGRVQWLDSWGEAARAQSGQGAEPVKPGDPLPCPFCGSTDVGGARGAVGCYRCPAEIAVQNANTAYAVELWNNRVKTHHQPAQQGSVPEAKEIIDRVVEELENGFVRCERCGDQEDTATLDCMTDLKRLKALLSTPTGLKRPQPPKEGKGDEH